MSQQSTWLQLRFPRDLTTVQALAALLAVNGLSPPGRQSPIVLEAVGTYSGVTHHLRAPIERGAAITRQLQNAIPGLSVEAAQSLADSHINRARRAWQSTKSRSLRTDQPEAISGGLLAALAAVGPGELLLMRWLLGPVRRPGAVGDHVRGTYESGVLAALAKAPFIPPADLDSEARRALRLKRALPGWRAVLHIGVQANTVARQRQLLGQLASAIRVAQGPGVEIGFDGLRPAVVNDLKRLWRWGLVINVGELVGLTAWPLGDADHLPVARVRSRLLPPSRALTGSGYVIGTSSYPGSERPLAVPIRDSLKHIHAIGATGSGKSTVALNVIIQAMAAGCSVCVIEPKGDLIAEVLARVPKERLDELVLIDPTAPGPIVGLNPLVQPGVPGELIVDQVLCVFKGLFGDAIGPRSQDILTAGLLTLVAQPVSSPFRTLVALPLLFTNARFRARLLQNINDPIGLMPFWAWWDALSPGEQSSVLAAPMNKIRQFVVRPKLRRTIGQVHPKFDVREPFTRRRIVLLNMPKGALGPVSSGLLGSMAVSMVWQAALGRTAIPPDRRHPVLLVVDEFQDFIHLSQDFADVLVQARGLGLGVFLTHQHLGQIADRNLKAAVLNNVRSRLVFVTGHDDAVQLVKTDRRLTPEDVTGLGAFQAYASLLTDNEVQPYASIRTLPPPPETSDPAQVRRASAERWGVAPGEIDRQLENLVGLEDTKSEEQLSPTTFGVRTRVNRPGGTGEAQP